jgi:hypothetical protein
VNEREHLEDPNVDGWIILKLFKISYKFVVQVELFQGKF